MLLAVRGRVRGGAAFHLPRPRDEGGGFCDRLALGGEPSCFECCASMALRSYVLERMRFLTASTCTPDHLPPRGVATPRASSALAMARADVTPLCSISAMMGATFLAKRSASAFRLATARPRACSSRGLPRTVLAEGDSG